MNYNFVLFFSFFFIIIIKIMTQKVPWLSCWRCLVSMFESGFGQPTTGKTNS